MISYNSGPAGMRPGPDERYNYLPTHQRLDKSLEPACYDDDASWKK